MQKYQGKLVVIKWIDSRGANARWQYLTDKEDLPVVCFSVGWIIKETKKYKTITPHLSDEQDSRQGCGDMTIPTNAIESISKLNLQPIQL